MGFSAQTTLQIFATRHIGCIPPLCRAIRTRSASADAARWKVEEDSYNVRNLSVRFPRPYTLPAIMLRCLLQRHVVCGPKALLQCRVPGPSYPKIICTSAVSTSCADAVFAATNAGSRSPVSLSVAQASSLHASATSLVGLRPGLYRVSESLSN